MATKTGPLDIFRAAELMNALREKTNDKNIGATVSVGFMHLVRSIPRHRSSDDVVPIGGWVMVEHWLDYLTAILAGDRQRADALEAEAAAAIKGYGKCHDCGHAPRFNHNGCLTTRDRVAAMYPDAFAHEAPMWKPRDVAMWKPGA